MQIKPIARLRIFFTKNILKNCWDYLELFFQCFKTSKWQFHLLKTMKTFSEFAYFFNHSEIHELLIFSNEEKNKAVLIVLSSR